MKSKIEYLIVGKQKVYCIVLCTMFFFSNCKNNVIETIQYEYIGCVGIKSPLINRSYSLFYQYESIKKVLMDDFNYNTDNDTLLLSLDFHNYDYIVTYGKKLTNMIYDKNYAKKNDHCEYIKDLKPIRVYYSDFESENQIFIYKVYEKEKYRHLCP